VTSFWSTAIHARYERKPPICLARNGYLRSSLPCTLPDHMCCTFEARPGDKTVAHTYRVEVAAGFGVFGELVGFLRCGRPERDPSAG
jgi:hypothetical protein